MSREITLEFKGQTYRIPANRAFKLGAEVEDVVTFAEMASWGPRPKFFKIAMALGVMLRFAGAKVSDEEVKDEIDASIASAPVDGVTQDTLREMFAMRAVEQLRAILFKGAPAPEGGEASPGKPTAS